jgi:hypothetical protein
MVKGQQIVLAYNEAVGMEVTIYYNTQLNFNPTIILRIALIATANTV